MSNAVSQNHYELDIRGILNAQSIKRLAHSALSLSMNEIDQSELAAVTMENISLAHVYHGNQATGKRAARRGGTEKVYRSSRIDIAEGLAGIFQPSLVQVDKVGTPEASINLQGSLTFDHLELSRGLRDLLVTQQLILFSPAITAPNLGMSGSIVPGANRGLTLVEGSASFAEAPVTLMDLEPAYDFGELVG